MGEYVPTPEQMAAWPRHIVAVTGAVWNAAGELLLVRSGWRGWEMPGGQAQQGEDLLTALVREVAEETGCTCTVDRLLGVYSNLGAPYNVQFLFACTYTAGTPTPSAETPEVAWCLPAEALARITRPTMLGRVHDAMAAAPGIVYRAYRLRPYEFVGEWQV